MSPADEAGLRGRYADFNEALRTLYEDDLLKLADGEKRPDFDDGVFEKAAKAVYDNGSFDIDVFQSPEAGAVISETMRVLDRAIDGGLPHEVPDTVRNALESNAFIFSGFKAYHSLREVGLSVVGDNGIKPFRDFLNDVRNINERYNHNYLYAEYNHAVGSSLMAAKWQDIERDGDRYNLQYRTAGDDRVREEHAAMHGITLPPSDPFWDKYYPPNGWNCRCTAVQVNRDRYGVSDPDRAMSLGDDCTSGDKRAIFRYNAGKSLNLFPPKHPYYKTPADAKKVIKKVAEEQHREKRINNMIKELPNNLTDEEKKAIAENNLELEKALGFKKGSPMSYFKADRQHTNPNYGKSRCYGNNCQTCTPAYMLRLRGFHIIAKGNTPKSLSDYLSRGNVWKVWKNIDGTPAEHTSLKSWMSRKGYGAMTPKRYLEFFDDNCKETGIYAVSIEWNWNKEGKHSGHTTVLQRLEDGGLRYIEPQRDNSPHSHYLHQDTGWLAVNGKREDILNHRGIMRIDNKLFNTDFTGILAEEPKNVE